MNESRPSALQARMRDVIAVTEERIDLEAYGRLVAAAVLAHAGAQPTWAQLRDATLAIAKYSLEQAERLDELAAADGAGVPIKQRIFSPMHARVYFHVSRYAGATSASLYRRWQPLTVRSLDPWPPLAGGSLRAYLKHLQRWGLVEHAGSHHEAGKMPMVQWRPVEFPKRLDVPVSPGVAAEVERLELDAGTDVTLAAALSVLRAAIAPAGA